MPGRIYKTRKAAEADAKLMSLYNPVGFEVRRIVLTRKTHEQETS